jgi:hypothetical protein
VAGLAGQGDQGQGDQGQGGHGTEHEPAHAGQAGR